MSDELTNQSTEPAQSPTRAIERWARLGFSLLVVSAVWLVGLPWLGKFSPVAEHIKNQQTQGIDPSAVFYSELEILPPVVHRIERLQQSNRDDFWSW